MRRHMLITTDLRASGEQGTHGILVATFGVLHEIRPELRPAHCCRVMMRIFHSTIRARLQEFPRTDAPAAPREHAVTEL